MAETPSRRLFRESTSRAARFGTTRATCTGPGPSSIEVELLRDGVEIDSRVVTAGTNWSFTFRHLPVDDGYGNIYSYEIREDGVNGYFSRIDGTTVTNSLIDGSTPLYAMLGAGDTVPAWVWICGSCGLLALALAILLGKRKRRTN